MADLLSYFQQQLTFQESVLKLCQPELESSQTHISGVNSCVLRLIEKYFNLSFKFSKFNKFQVLCQIIAQVWNTVEDLLIITVFTYRQLFKIWSRVCSAVVQGCHGFFQGWSKRVSVWAVKVALRKLKEYWYQEFQLEIG